MKKVSILTAVIMFAVGITVGALISQTVDGVWPKMIAIIRDSKITVQRAKDIAFEKAGISEKDIGPIKIEVDAENGQLVYDLEFYYNDVKYSAEISASDGRVLSWEKEVR